MPTYSPTHPFIVLKRRKKNPSHQNVLKQMKPRIRGGTSQPGGLVLTSQCPEHINTRGHCYISIAPVISSHNVWAMPHMPATTAVGHWSLLSREEALEPMCKSELCHFLGSVILGVLLKLFVPHVPHPEKGHRHLALHSGMSHENGRCSWGSSGQSAPS